MKATITSILFFFVFLLQAQIIYFDNQYDYMQHPESPLDIILSDSSYLMVGGESSNGSVFNNRPLFLKIDQFGNIQDQKSIGVGEESSATARYVFSVADSLLIVQGTRSNYEPIFDTQLFLSKVDKQSLDTLWVKNYGIDTLYEATGKAIKTTDGGFAVAGWVFNETGYKTRTHLMKIDSLGTLEFYKHYTTDSTITHSGMSLVQTEDEGFLILGFRRYHTSYQGEQKLITDRFLLKTDSLGEQEWIQFYPAEIDSLTNSNSHTWIIQLADGNYLSGGKQVYFKETFPYLEDFRRYSITKYDPEGNILWDKVYGENDATFWNNGIETSNGNLVFVGYERDNPAPGGGRRQYGVIASTNSDGELLWFRKYYSAPENVDMDFLKALVEAPDSGYVACGDSFGPWADSTYQNAWVIKTDSVGCLEVHCDSVITSTEEVIPNTAEAYLQLFPNPASDQLTVDIGADNTLLGIQIFDSSGKRVEDIQFFRSHHLHTHTLSLGSLPAGMYVVQVRTDQGWWSGKVVKQ